MVILILWYIIMVLGNLMGTINVFNKQIFKYPKNNYLILVI